MKKIMYLGLIALGVILSGNLSAQTTDAKVKSEIKKEVKVEEVNGEKVLTIKKTQDGKVISEENVQTNLNLNKELIPQEINYDGKPDLVYNMNNKIIVLDSYNETDYDGKYIRMKIKNKEALLKMEKDNSSKSKRVYSNNDYTITFYDIIYGTCAGEGAQNVEGKLLIESKTEQNTIIFKGSDALYSSKKCQEIGNG